MAVYQSSSGRSPFSDSAVSPRMLRFSLSTLITLVTSVTVAFSIVFSSPGLGILLLVIALLACYRTIFLIDRKKDLGESPDAVEQGLLFARSMGIVMLYSIAPIGTGIAGFLLGQQLARVRDARSDCVSIGKWEGFFVGLVVGGCVGLCLGFRALHSWLNDAQVHLNEVAAVETPSAATHLVSRRSPGISLVILLTIVAVFSTIRPGASTITLALGAVLSSIPMLIWLRVAAVSHRRHSDRLSLYLFLQSFGVALTIVAALSVVAFVACLSGYYAEGAIQN